uniref:Transcription initiation factor TFIID subunit 13 n=1 Tax=Panagrolaimus sp. PS1159 TaxID=55785 RepID=A0AC35GHQ0_9BILA
MEGDKEPFSAASLFNEENVEESKEDPFEKFRCELRAMVFGFGDVKDPHEATLDLIYKMTVEYITNVAKIGQSFDPRNKLSLEAIHYMTKNDPNKFQRVQELLKMKEEIKKVKKDFDTNI